MDPIKHRILFLYSSPIGVANTGSGSGYVLTCVARIRLRSFAISPFGLNTLRIEPPAGRLYLNAKTPSRPLGGYISTPKHRAARWAAISQRQNAEPPAGRLYFNAIIV